MPAWWHYLCRCKLNDKHDLFIRRTDIGSSQNFHQIGVIDELIGD